MKKRIKKLDVKSTEAIPLERKDELPIFDTGYTITGVEGKKSKSDELHEDYDFSDNCSH